MALRNRSKKPNESSLSASIPSTTEINRFSFLQEGELGVERAEKYEGADEPWSYRSLRLPLCLLLVAARGNLEIRSSDNAELLACGSAAFVEQGRSVAISVQPAADYEVYLFHLTTESVPQMQASGRMGAEGFGCLCWSSREHEEIVSLCERVCERFRDETRLGRLGSRAALQELVYTVLRSEGKPREEDTTISAVAATKRYIDEHYAQRLTIDRLCRIASLNAKYYMELFKKLYGVSPIAYLNERRMAAARVLLLVPGASVREVSRRVGFGDEYYFSRRFKQHAGMAPSVFSRARKLRVASYNYPVTGQLLALGIELCAAAFSPEWRRLADRYEAIALRLSDDSHHREQLWETNRGLLQNAEPDLIIGTDYIHSWESDRLRQIADTHILDWCETDWRRQLHDIASLVGCRTVAGRWLSEYGRKAAVVRERVRRSVRDDTVLALLVMETDYLVYGSRNLADVLYGDLGLRSPLPFKGVASILPERLAEFDADRIIVTVGDYEAAESMWERLQSAECWQRLKAVRTGRVYRVPLAPWFEYSATAHSCILNEISCLLADECPSQLPIIIHGNP